MSILRPREHLLFVTHEAPYRASSWAVGEVVQQDGRFYRVSRWTELDRVALERGGSVGQWEVWGRRVTDRQIRREVISAAEAILDSERCADD